MSLIDDLRWYDPVILPKYPHLSPDDSRIWGTFLQINSESINKIAYDIPVGKGRLPSPNSEANQIKNWRYLSSFKIDVLAATNFGYWLFECKHEANPESVGQIIVYSYYLKDQFHIESRIRKTILCDTVHPDLYGPCNQLDIEIFDIGRLYYIPRTPRLSVLDH